MIRLGVVGHGARIGIFINQSLRKIAPEISVVGIVDPNESDARGRLDERDRQSAVFYGALPEMMHKAKLDALAIGTRCHLHTPYAIEAAKYDIPLFLEKPVAINVEQAIALERAYEGSKCPVLVSFPLRFSPLCRLARQYLQSGAVGSLEHVLAVNYVPYGTIYWDLPYRDYQITQGLFLQKATHDFDYLMHLMGSSITCVAARKSVGRVFGNREPAGKTCSTCDKTAECPESPRNRLRNHSGGIAGDHACTFGVDCGTPQTGMNEDSSSALIEFASGAQGVYTQVFFSRRDAAMRGATISGYQGTVSFDWYKSELRHVRHHQPFTETVKAESGINHFGGDVELAYGFIDMIRGKASSQATIQSGIQSVYACLAAKESAETGKFVKVRQVGD